MNATQAYMNIGQNHLEMAHVLQSELKQKQLTVRFLF